MRIVRALAYAWASPGTVLGLLLGATTASRPRVRDGAVEFRSTRGFARLHRRLGFSAVTLGHVVIAQPGAGDDVWAHEMAHVRQWEILGPAMLALYPLASLAGYRRNPFEAWARRAAGH